MFKGTFVFTFYTNFNLKKITTIGCSPIFKFICKSNGCKWKKNLETSKGWKGRLKELPIKMVAGFILSGLSYENYSEVFHVADLQTCSSKIYTDTMKVLLKKGNLLLDEMFKINQEKTLRSDIIIATDGAWSHRGWSANECCVGCFDLYGGCLLDMEILIRRLEGDNYGNYEGASSGMEGEGIRRICRRLLKACIRVGTVLHDGDGVTIGIVKEFFPDAEEINDGGHAGKNFRKAVIKLAKKFTGVKKMGEVCLKAFRYAMTQCDSNPKKFNQLMWQQYKHFCDLNHEHCTHAIDYKPKSWNWVVDLESREALKKEFQKVVERSEFYCKNLSSNICESFANSRTKYTDKRLHQRLQFQLGCIMAGLVQCARKEDNFNWKKLLLEGLDINSSTNMEKNFEAEIQLQLKNMDR